MHLDVHLEYVKNKLTEFTIKTQEGFFTYYFVEPEKNRFILFKRIRELAAKDCIYILCAIFGNDVVKSRKSKKEIVVYSYGNN